MKRRFFFLLFVGVLGLFLLCCARSRGNIPLLVNETPMPDIPLGERGKGFTCTGIAYDAKEDVYYIGNCGKTLPEDERFRASIVKVKKDNFQYIDEIVLDELYPKMSDIQGVTIDTSDDTIFFCSTTESRIRHITKDGKHKGEFYAFYPKGIAYDSRTDTLWVLSGQSLKHFNKAGKVIRSIDFALEGQDQIFLDKVKNAIYLTAGNNYQGENYVYRVQLLFGRVPLAYTLKDSYAVEGIHMEGESMYILNDGYYHGAKTPVNQVNQYDLTRLVTEPEYENAVQNRK